MNDNKKSYNRKYWQQHYSTIKEMHRCARCGKIDENTKAGATRCKDCAEANKKYQRELREKKAMKQSLQFKAKSGYLTAERPKYERKESRDIDPYLSYAEDSKEVINACMTCPYPDCKHEKVIKCKHYNEVVYGKNNSEV